MNDQHPTYAITAMTTNMRHTTYDNACAPAGACDPTRPIRSIRSMQLISLSPVSCFLLPASCLGNDCLATSLSVSFRYHRHLSCTHAAHSLPNANACVVFSSPWDPLSYLRLLPITSLVSPFTPSRGCSKIMVRECASERHPTVVSHATYREQNHIMPA